MDNICFKCTLNIDSIRIEIDNLKFLDCGLLLSEYFSNTTVRT